MRMTVRFTESRMYLEVLVLPRFTPAWRDSPEGKYGRNSKSRHNCGAG